MTVYVDKDRVGELSSAGLSGLGSKGTRVVIHNGKATLLFWSDKNQRWQATATGRYIPVSDTPAVGLAPLELWKPSNDFSDALSWKSMHAGNPIVSMDFSQPMEQPVQQVGQYPAEGFGTGAIVSPEEQARRDAVRARVEQANAQQAEQARAEALRQQNLQAQALVVAARQAEAERQAEVLSRYERMKARPISTPFLDAQLPQPVQAPLIQTDQGLTEVVQPEGQTPVDDLMARLRAVRAQTPSNENQVPQAGSLPNVQGKPSQTSAEVQATPGTAQQKGANPEVDPFAITKEEQAALSILPSDEETDAIFNARERAKKKTSRNKQTSTLAKYLNDAGIYSSWLPIGIALTHVSDNRDGTFGVRVERHTLDGGMRAELITVSSGDSLSDAISKKFSLDSQVAAVTGAQFVPGGALQAVGGLTVDFGGLKMSVIPSPDDPSIGFVTGLSGSGVAGKLSEIKAALKNAGFRDIQYRPDNEDGRSAARVRLFESLKAKIASPSTPSGVRLRKEPIYRSNPAAAQRIATLGQAAPSSEGAASSAFGVRSYGGTTITREQVASHNQEVEKRAAAGDPTALRVQKLIASVDTDQGVGRFAGYATLPDSGKNKALAYYSTSLYRQIGKWLEGGEFKFQPLAVSRSATSSSGKTQAVQMEAKTVGETPLGEDTAETNLTRSSEPIVQQVPLAKPVKLQEESVKTILDLQRELGVSSESLVRIIHAFQDQNTSDLDDQELAALEAATPTLNQLKGVNYSLSTLIREPLGLERTQEAVNQWKAVHGGQDIAIRVVDDPNLKTPDGRTVAAQVEMVPGGVPIITINASQVGSAAEVHEKIWHELFHPVWNDPSVQQAWGEVMQSVDQRMVEGQLARGYSPQEAAMEAAIDLAAMKVGDKKVRSAWKRFLDKVWNAMKKAFGFEVRPNNFEALMISALRQASRPWNGQQQNQYNQDVAALDKAHLEAVARGDMATAQRLVDEAAKKAGYSTAKPGNNASKRNSLRVKLSRQALTDLALSQASWRDWYKEHQDTLNAFFGSDAGLFQKILAITSQAASVKANVGLALKAFAQFKQGLAFDGYLPAVIGNLNALRAETQIQGRKIGAYTSANEGQTDAVVVDRHIARMLFGVDTPSAAQFAKAARVLTEIANEIGWEPRQVQAALWAASIVKSGKQPQSYGQYLKQLNSNGTLSERIGHVVDRSSEIYGISGSGVADSGGISTETEGSKSADPVTYDDAGKVVLLSQRFNPQNKDIRYSVANNLYVTSPTKFNTIAANGQTEAVAAQGQVSSAIVPESTLKVVSDLEAKQDRNPVENATLKALKGVSNIAQVAHAADQLRANVDGMPSYTTINQLPEEFKSVGAQSVMATHFYLNQFRKSIRTQMERASNDVASLSQELADLTPDRLLATLTSHEADEMLVNLQKFLDVEQGKLGTSTASRTREELDKASAAIVGMRRKIEAISAGLQAMAKEMPLPDFDSPAAVKAWLESRMADKNLPPLMGQDVFQTIRVALNKDSTLHNRLSMVRGLMADTQAAKKELEGLAKQLGSGKPAVVLKRIIEMKGDARAVLDNVRRLDLRLDRAMNKIEGLTEAGNVMDQMQVDPSYQERVKSAFDYAGFKYSGVIRFDDQPSGNQTLRAPDGTEYRINFSPDFAVERQNLDTLGKWMEKTLDALTNPESPQYITDPATRTSYANTMAFVSRFLMDKRGLVESAWADAGSVQTMNAILGAPEKLVQLKFLLGDHLNTRFNLYRNLAGRAGLDLVNRSRAIDRFMAEAKNILDATRTQNAAARRKAILSHNLNPDDPADYELWNSTVNSWILSQNQNPGSRPVQEGVHVGMGLEVTKEDIAFAGLQHKFSRAISEAYSGIIGEDMVQDPNAPGYNPEETLFGQVFSRKAMQFGFATGRKFSHAGREYTKLWMDARSKDLAEYKARVAAAPEGTEVPMVYTERKKVAEESMEGHVYAHIRESNPEYTSTADKGLREAYRDVANAIRSGTDFRSITDLSMALAEAMTTDEKDVGAFEAEQALMKALDRDVVNYNMAAEVVGSTSPNETVTDLPPALRSIKTAKGALVKARGKMVAPSFFYDYSIGTDLDRSSMVQMGKQALMISEVNAARNMVAAMRDKLDGYERQIDKNAKVIGRNGKPVGRGRAIAELDADLKKRFKEGAEFITYKMLKKHIAALETAIGDREKSMVRERVTEEESFKVSMVNALGGGVISSILSAPAPMINNMLAVVTDPIRIGMMVGGPLTAINWAGRGAMSALKYSFQKLVNGVVDATGIVLSRDAKAKLAEMASFITGSMLDTRSNLERSGTIDAPESFTSIWSRYKNNPAAFGNATRGRETEFSKNFSRVMTSPLFAYGFLPAIGEWLKQRAPGSGDRMVNYVNAEMATLLSNRVAPHLWNWVNEQDGTTVDEKIRSAMEAGALRGSDLGVSDESMANIRDILGPAGSLEKLALDYYRANPNGAKGPLLNQSQREGVEFEIAAITNKETDSTRPDITKGGAGMENTFRRMLYLFARYILQHMGVNKRVFGIKGGDGGGLGKDLKKGLAYLFVLAMTLLAGSLALPIKQLVRTLLQREPLTSPTIVQAFDSPEMAGKYLASAAMGVLPVGAAAVGMVLTGNGVNGPITANFFDSNPIAGAANNLIQAATSAYQTKDITYPALDLARKTFWFSQPLINAAMPGDTMAREANRAVRTAATGLETRPQSGGGMGRSTPVTPFVRDAVAATYEGNAEAFAAAKQKAIDYYVSQGKTAKEAEARFNSSVSGRDPFRSVFGRTPTADETATIQRRLTSGQADTLSKANFSRPARLKKTKGSVSLRKRRKSKAYRGLRRPSSRRVRLRRVAYS
jgi:hypothetical protein